MDGNDGNGDAVKAAVHTSIQILEDSNGCLYVDPDAQHYSRFKGSADILSIYSREIEALRRTVSLLMCICINQLELMPRNRFNGIYQRHFDRCNDYIKRASWELAHLSDAGV